jgi:hypothetical protein
MAHPFAPAPADDPWALFEPLVPAGARDAVLAAQTHVEIHGMPPAGWVLIAGPEGSGIHVRGGPLAAALAWAAKDPEVQARLREAAEMAKDAALSCVLLAVGDDGTYWCGVVGPLTGAEEASA